MGGAFDFEFGYDTLNRLVGTGTRKIILDGENQPIPTSNFAQSTYELEMHYNNVGGITGKRQHHERDQVVVAENTYENHYKYVDSTHKLDRVDDASTGNIELFGYDYNGNVIEHKDPNGTRKKCSGMSRTVCGHSIMIIQESISIIPMMTKGKSN